jgi:hypothetical protein
VQQQMDTSIGSPRIVTDSSPHQQDATRSTACVIGLSLL